MLMELRRFWDSLGNRLVILIPEWELFRASLFGLDFRELWEQDCFTWFLFGIVAVINIVVEILANQSPLPTK